MLPLTLPGEVPGGNGPLGGSWSVGSGGSGVRNIDALLASKPTIAPLSNFLWPAVMVIGPCRPGCEKVMAPNGSVRPHSVDVAGSPTTTGASGTPSPV